MSSMLLRKSKISETEVVPKCVKLQLAENVAAYLEDRELDRDIGSIECSKDVIEKVCGNYLIIKNILSHLSWQDKLICKHVCTLWHGIVHTLQKEQLCPVDFYVSLRFQRFQCKDVAMNQSLEFYTEPMAIFTFCNTVPDVYIKPCKAFVPCPCEPVCELRHNVTDYIYQKTTAPKDCMYAMKTSSVSYLPLPLSPTYTNDMTRKPPGGFTLFIGGIYIPKIPGVEFKMINFKSNNSIQQELKPQIKRLTEKYIIKGVVACLTENFLLYSEQDNVESLEFLRTMQPDIPFAFGGCLVEDTANSAQDMAAIVDSVNKSRQFVSGNFMSLGMFLIPKNEEPKHNFEVYSLVIESTEWTTAQIQQSIQEFAQRVPKYEHSVALKFSCVGREKKHGNEQNLFRKCFPNTRQAGCFGNGELGVNHPKRKPKLDAKKPRDDLAYEKVHSYSTVYFYICWGKILAEAELE